MVKINIKDFTEETDLTSNGVYMISHKDTSLKYIGSTFYKGGFKGRWLSHINGWKRGVGNVVLLRIYHKYGLEGFKFTIIEKIEDKNIVRDRERFWIDYYDTYNNGANTSLDTYQAFKNYKHRPYTEEDRLKYLQASPTKKKVYVYDIKGNLQYVFPSSSSCDKFFGLPKKTTNWAINHPLRSIYNRQYCPSYILKQEGWSPEKERKQRMKERALKVAANRKKNGTYWMDNDYKNKIRLANHKSQKIELRDLRGALIHTFNSMNECDDFLELTRGTTSKVLKGKAKTLKRKFIPNLAGQYRANLV